MKQKDQNAFQLIIIAVLAIGLVYALYQIYLLKQDKQPLQMQEVSTVTPTSELAPTGVTVTKISTTPKPVQNGADLEDIKYSLPTGWKASMQLGGLYLSPGEGHLLVKTYPYSGTIGRREFYCKTIEYVCFDQTRFVEMKIGNITGYMADPIDNSGGGPDYFGAKGNVFYVIHTYNPPNPNEFNNNYQEVMNSLIF